MRVHRCLRPFRVTGPQCREDFPVLGVGASCPYLDRFGITVEDRSRQFQRRSEDLFEPGALGGAGDHSVELGIQLVETFEMFIPAQAPRTVSP